jgi:uncharacterized BrkB/YihY/UPF0761 family membrane protein
MSDIHDLTGRPDEGGSFPRAREPERREPLDRHELMTVILAMVGGAFGTGLLIAMALTLLLIQDACTVTGPDCRGGVFVAGFFLALVIPPLIAIAGFLATAVFLHRRKPRPWRVPLLALAASAAVWLVGATLCILSVPGYGVGDLLGSIGGAFG